MNKFKKTYGSGPRSRPAGPREERPQKFDAVCSKCGKACQVPFRPNGTRPVYCHDCFGGPHQAFPNKGSSPARDVPARPLEPRAGGKTISDLERQIGAMNTKIDTMLRILQTMSGPHEESDFAQAPVFTKKEFPKKRAK